MNEFKIDASPTKEFFIDMLTRDIPLDRAILDLIDNSVDASRLKKTDNPIINLDISKYGFSIEDNCGGMSLHAAKTYAFKFGRSKEDKREESQENQSIGQFGVGMKRALFKIGKIFEVTSKTNNEYFKITVNVDNWKNVDTWEFDFEDLSSVNNDNTCFTKIVVTELFDTVASSFSLDNFINELSRECSSAHFKAINSGLKIFLNKKEISSYEIRLLTSDIIKPIKITKIEDGVLIRITAGISERRIKEGGWYIVCNGRLVQEAEQSRITGWKGDGVPQYHADYAFFRGIVEFESNDSSLLPWTTTKTGVDNDKIIFKVALFYMKETMKNIITFLRERAKEDKDIKEGLLDSTPLNDAIQKAKLTRLDNISESEIFVAPPTAKRLEVSNTASIQYIVKIDELNKVKSCLGVSSNKEVGELTFRYYFDYECE